MHLLIPHASALGEAARPALQMLALPQLAELLARLQPQALPVPAPAAAASAAASAAPPAGNDADADDADDPEYRLSLPHEAALAALAGWPGRDGNWPLAAWWAAQDGLSAAALAHPGARTPAEAGLALLTPVHWQVGTEQVSLIDPQQLELGAEESRALFEAVRPGFEAAGWRVSWGAPLRWYASHATLHGLAAASIDRVIGRSIDLWLPRGAEARLLRRLQVEVQMLLHEHPVNDARLARRHLPVNSFWLGGTGPAAVAPLPADLVVDARLGAPLLGGDWAAWVAAWQALDAGPVADLLARAQAGEPVGLTLCGERHARHWRSPGTARPAWRRLLARFTGPASVAVRPVLEQL
ncbi:MAG: hypothetical protein RLZZ584_1533 [Pseudomonadota bacterium]